MNDPLPPHDEKLTRWIDGALTPEQAREFEAQLPSLADAEKDRKMAQSLGHLLRQHAALPAEPPSPEFFTSQIMKQLREEQAGATSPQRKAAATPSFFERFIRPWIAPAAVTAAAAYIFLVRHDVPVSDVSQTRVVSAWSPELQAEPKSYFSEDAGAQVIDVSGLEDYPAARSIVGASPEGQTSQVAVLAP